VSTIPTLLLAVTGTHAAQFGSRSQKAFEGRDGSIGRSEDCDWVLSSSGVSRVHAMIRCLNGIYFIEDRSTNGMLLNGVPLVKPPAPVLVPVQLIGVRSLGSPERFCESTVVTPS